MKILFLTSRLPYPPDRGDRLRMHHFLRELAARHDVRLLSFVASREENRNAGDLRKRGIAAETVLHGRAKSWMSTLGALPSKRPFQVAYYESSRMRRRVEDAARDRDLVIAHLIRMAPYLEGTPSSARRVVDLCDCISSEYREALPFLTGAKRAFYAEEAKRVARFERDVLRHVDEAWVISEAEIPKLGNLGPSSERIHVVPNGFPLSEGASEASGWEQSAQHAAEGPSSAKETSPVAAARRSGRLAEPPEGPSEGCRLIFTGNMSVPHNVDAACFLAKEILAVVREEIPNAHLTIAGANPSAAVRALRGPAVDVTGWVEDLDVALRGASIFVAPMRFVAGLQNKVLQAMSSSVPVVTSELVRHGLGARDREHLVVAATAREYAANIVSLWRDRAYAKRLGAAGCEFVRARFSWKAVVERVAAIERAAEKSAR
jgi:glycosyltransferase involved in cell wall biosynthesis